MTRWKLTIGVLVCAGILATATVPAAGAHFADSCQPHRSSGVAFTSATCRFDCGDEVNATAAGANIQVTAECGGASCTAWAPAGADSCVDSSSGCDGTDCHNHGTCTTEPYLPAAFVVAHDSCSG